MMGAAYPGLKQQALAIKKTIAQEERLFDRTLEDGLKILDKALAKLKDQTIPGELAFKLYDTYGFPLDLTQDIAKERGLSVDAKGFDQEMAKQKARAKGKKFAVDYNDQLKIDASLFQGYEKHKISGAKVVALYKDQAPCKRLSAGEKGMLILDQTPFYAESGGQVGDQGTLTGGQCEIRVLDCQKQQQAYVHLVSASGCGAVWR